MLYNRCKKEIPPDAAYCPCCGKKQSLQNGKSLKRANGTGSVYKLQGRRRRPWVASKNKVIIGYYEKKTDALEALERISGKNLTERYNMTFSDVFPEASYQRYTVHFYRNVFTVVPRGKMREVSLTLKAIHA